MSCPSGKVRYRDRIAAELALVSTGKNDQRRAKNEHRSYRCPDCKGWHLTSRNGGSGAAR